MINSETYWRKTGYKFYEDETGRSFEEIFTDCSNSMPWADEEGFFSSFLCLKDCKECDKQCHKHIKLNPLIEEFVMSLNKSLEKK